MRLFLTISAVLLGALPARGQFVIYDSNPRIIHVPQSVTPQSTPRAAVTPADDARIERKPQPRRTLSKAAEPERRQVGSKPAAEPAPQRAEASALRSEPKRTLLSAPTSMPAYGPGSLTPIYPTPRWRNTDPPPAATADNDE